MDGDKSLNFSSIQDIIQKKQQKPSLLENVYAIMLITSGVVFVVVSIIFTFAILMPKLKSIYALQDQIADKKSELDTLTTKLNKLQSVDQQKLEQDNQLVNTAIPSEITLAKLGDVISKIALNYSLKMTTISLSESSSKRSDLEVSGQKISSITGPFQFKGTQDNLMKFIIAWYNSEYILRFSEINYSKVDETEWKLDLQILGYSMSEIKTLDPSLALPLYNQKTLDTLKQRKTQ